MPDSKQAYKAGHKGKYQNAVILLNMGGPSSLSEVDVFLKNMFADPCILSVKSVMLRRAIGSMIVNARVQKSKKIYATLGGASPITSLTFSLTQRLQEQDDTRYIESSQDINHTQQSYANYTFYTYAMRYAPPFAVDVLREIQQMGIKDITLFSMYPQYSSTTTFSSFKDIADSLKILNFHPSVRIIDRYGSDEGFIRLVVDEIIWSLVSNSESEDSKDSTNLKDSGGFIESKVQFVSDFIKDRAKDFILILSAHSVPLSRIKKGDPYKSECEESARLLKAQLESRGVVFKDVILSYQSKIGPVKWLEPNTQSIIRDSIKTTKNVIIYPISFTIDNSESLYELGMLYCDIARDLGCKEFIVCPCLNDSAGFVGFIKSLLRQTEDVR